MTKEEYEKYINAEIEIDADELLCFHCDRTMKLHNEIIYEIRRTDKNGGEHLVCFHEKCFQSLAGETYMMEFIL
jgi:hypothetical protein